MSKLTDEEINKIAEAVAKAYEKAGKKLVTATKVKEIKEDGTIEGEMLIDNRDEKEIN